MAQQRAIAGLGGGVEHAGGQAPHGYAFGSRRARPRAVIARSSRARGSSAGGGRSRSGAQHAAARVPTIYIVYMHSIGHRLAIRGNMNQGQVVPSRRWRRGAKLICILNAIANVAPGPSRRRSVRTR